MATIDLIIIFVWVICGILAYGINKNHWRQMFEKEHQLLKKMHRLSKSRYQKLIEEQNYTGYGRHTELICVNAGILGPGGLLIALMFSLQKNKKIGLCYRMPKELIGKQITKHRDEMDEMLEKLLNGSKKIK